MVAEVQDAASKFSWLLIPFSVPFLWLLFPLRRRYRLYDHTVFVTYSLSFMMILVIAGGLLVAAGCTSLASMLFFVPPIHMYRQLKGAYEPVANQRPAANGSARDVRLHRRRPCSSSLRWRSVHASGRQPVKCC